MANWKKVIVSGSNAHLNHITSSGNISASGFLFGNLPSGSLDQVVIYNTSSGRLEFKTLNLVNTTAAPNLFIADIGGYSGLVGANGASYSSPTGESTISFKLSYDTGSSGGGAQTPMTIISASNYSGAGSTVSTVDSGYFGINGLITATDLGNTTEFYNPGADPSLTDNTPPTDILSGLIIGTTKVDIPIRLQGFDDTAVPAYPTGLAFNNYKAGAFNDGGIGSLKVYVNTNDFANPTAQVNLETNPGVISGSGHGNNVTINLSATSSNIQATDGAVDTLKHHRSGSGAHSINNGDIIIPSALQNDGYNYAYVIHTGTKNGNDFGYITNFVQWFYDIAGANASIVERTSSLLEFSGFNSSSLNTTKSISGIKYYTNDSAVTANSTYKWGVKVENQYNAVYNAGSSAIQITGITTNTTNNFSFTQSKIDGVAATTFAGPTSNSSLNMALGALTGSVAAASASATLLTASAGAIVFPSNTFHHPDDFDATPAPSSFVLLEGLATNADISVGTASFNPVSTSHKNRLQVTSSNVNDFMVNSLTVNADENYFEDFKGETYRRINFPYTSGFENVDSASFAWDGRESVVGSDSGHNTGLIQYYTHLVYPGVFSGDNTTRGLYNPKYGPGGQPNYSSATGTREYIRYFKILQADQGGKNFNVEFVGSGSIVAESATLTAGSSDFKVYVMRTGGGGSSAFTIHNGAWVNQSDTSYGYTQTTGKIPVTENYTNINYANQANFLPKGVVKIDDSNGDPFAAGERIMVRIVVPQGWGGYLNALGITVNQIGSGGAQVLGVTETAL